MPWIKSYNTAYKRVLEDKAKPEAERILDAVITGEGNARAITIRGDALIKYLRANRSKIE
jgi:hypothetical protein